MDKNSIIKLKYHFEKVHFPNRPLSNPIERFVNLASQVIKISPSIIPYLNFGSAEKISNGILDPGLVAPQPKFDALPEQVRIRCIEDDSGPLVEYFYDKEGRPVEVILFNSFREKYTWSDDGKLISVSGRDSEITQFRYQKDWLLSSINYPNGSIFRYEYDNLNRLKAITYPDGIILKYARNEQGLLTRSECLNGVFEYTWDKDNLLQEIQYKDKTGNWGLNIREIKNIINLKFHPSSAISSQTLSSELGNWRYDKNGQLFEMIVTGGVRFKKRGDEESGLELWTHNGLTFYHFDKSKALMKMINTNGTNTIFRRNISDRTIILASAMGIAILRYDKNGTLYAEREAQANGISYKFNQQKNLQQINSDEAIINLNWTNDGKIKDFSVNDNLKCAIKHLTGIPNQILLKTSLGYLESIETVTRFIWNWEAMKNVRRLYDNNFQK